VVETKFQVYFQFQAAVHTGFTWGTECALQQDFFISYEQNHSDCQGFSEVVSKISANPENGKSRFPNKDFGLNVAGVKTYTS